LYEDYFHIAPGKNARGDFGDFRAPQIKFSIEYDEELAEVIEEIAQEQGLKAGTLGAKQRALDHGVMVPLFFLQSLRILRISLSGLSFLEHYRLGMCISTAAERLGRRIVVVASGDMSHRLSESEPYGFNPAGPEHDALVCDCIREADVERLLAISPNLCELAGECGTRSLIMMLGALDGLQIESCLLSYEGPFGVGYLTAAFCGSKESHSLLPRLQSEKDDRLAKIRETEDEYTRLARMNTEHYVQTGQCIDLPGSLPSEMLIKQAGVFVSIKKQGRLRGCIGTISPVKEHIAREIIENSVSAASRDPRFDPIQADELAELTYSVDVLAPAEPISGLHELDVERYGVIVSCGYRRGLLLPNLEGVDTVEQQIDIARQKAGIGKGERYQLERFEVVRHV
jgi:AmmeMemoRadiSam system protein A